MKTIIASEIAVLDSNVHTGGGTDATLPLQAALDEATTSNGVHLIVDGAALDAGNDSFHVFTPPAFPNGG